MTRNRSGDWLRYENPDEKLPWLEPAEDYDSAPALSRGKLIGGLLLLVVLVALLVGGLSLFRNREISGDPSGEAGLIKAPANPYKVQPKDAGGMNVEGQGDIVYAAGAGVEPDGTIDLSALPEQPVTRSMPGVEAGDVGVTALPPSTAAGGQAQSQQAPSQRVTAPPIAPPAAKPAPPKVASAVSQPAVPAPKPAAAPAAAPVPQHTGSGSYGLQLGAFSTKTKADAAWKSLSGRFAFIGALNKSVEPVGKGDTTLYRLRAVGVASRASADNLCGRMKVTGDSCAVVAP